MGFFTDLFSGAVGGAATSAARSVGSNLGVLRIENLCRGIGWGIDERVGETGLVLHFKDPLFSVRPLLITVADSGGLATFSVYSRGQFPANNVPPTLAYFLLTRNKDAGFAAWRVAENDNGTIGFWVAYTALLSALEPRVFQYICESACKEVVEFDAKLRQAGVV